MENLSFIKRRGMQSIPLDRIKPGIGKTLRKFYQIHACSGMRVCQVKRGIGL